MTPGKWQAKQEQAQRLIYDGGAKARRQAELDMVLAVAHSLTRPTIRLGSLWAKRRGPTLDQSDVTS